MKLTEILSSHKYAHSDKKANVMCLAQDITLQYHITGQKINQQEIKALTLVSNVWCKHPNTEMKI